MRYADLGELSFDFDYFEWGMCMHSSFLAWQEHGVVFVSDILGGADAGNLSKTGTGHVPC